MNYKISRELFEAVMSLDIERIEVTNIKINYSKVGQCQEDDDIKFLLMSFTISINDFFFKCKEWALKQGYSILSGKDDIYEQGKGFVCSIGNSTLLIKDFYSESEQQAVFDACQWILDNKDRQ